MDRAMNAIRYWIAITLLDGELKSITFHGSEEHANGYCDVFLSAFPDRDARCFVRPIRKLEIDKY